MFAAWNTELVDRLYDRHQQYVKQLRRDIVAANRSLGSMRPNRCSLRPLSRKRFVAVLTNPDNDREAVDLWVQRMIAGYEDAFPALRFAG